MHKRLAAFSLPGEIVGTFASLASRAIMARLRFTRFCSSVILFNASTSSETCATDVLHVRHALQFRQGECGGHHVDQIRQQKTRSYAGLVYFLALGKTGKW